jgi:hypothetical protein
VRIRKRVPLPAAGIVAAALAAFVLAGSGGAARPLAPATGNQTETAPVSTLDPAGTAREWRRLVAHRPTFRTQASCRPLRGVFYAATDWLRLATRLAANASPCAQYYVSIPPLVSDKTKPRPDQAWRIRALGSNFHAMAEIHWATWSRWVASTGSTWYEAGVEARRRMVAAGYDVTKGDTWAVNEFPSSVRAVAGADRANARELVRGLHDGDGGPAVRGTVFVIGVGQRANSLALYQNNLQNWLTDSAFWTDMTAYVSDWSQEVYADFRSYGVPGAPITTRRDYLNDYLQHELVLAGIGPPAIDIARAFLQSTYSPLANAAWQWESAYGWTVVAYDQMQAFVSAQTYAMRFFGAATGQALDHWGFAWQPRNATGVPSSQFTSETAAILDRLGVAIRDSAQTTNPSDPGSGGCGPPGQNLFCGGDLPGAAFTESWKSFRTWTQPILVFTTPPQTIPAGTPSAAMSIALQMTTGASQVASTDIAIVLSSSSPQGQFAIDPAGPWSQTLTLTLPAGSTTTGSFYYQDTRAGSPVLTAAASGITSGTQTQTVLPGPIVDVSIKPASATVPAGGALTFTAAGVDQFGNPVVGPATWTVDPPGLGKLQVSNGGTATFTAGARGGTGRITATVAGATGALSAEASVTVRPGRIAISSIRYGIGRNALLVSATVVDGARRPVQGAFVRLIVRRGGYRYFVGQARTAANGKAIYRLRPKKGCYRTAIIRASAPGYVWRPATPQNRFCK